MSQNPEINLMFKNGQIAVKSIRLPEGETIQIPPSLQELIGNLYLAGWEGNPNHADLPPSMGDDPDDD